MVKNGTQIRLCKFACEFHHSSVMEFQTSYLTCLIYIMGIIIVHIISVLFWSFGMEIHLCLKEFLAQDTCCIIIIYFPPSSSFPSLPSLYFACPYFFPCCNLLFFFCPFPFHGQSWWFILNYEPKQNKTKNPKTTKKINYQAFPSSQVEYWEIVF